MVAGMLRPGLSLVLFLALPAPAYADEPQTTASIPPEEKTKALKEARFVSFVFDGDQARAAGKLGDAARAYASALEVHDDPVVAGRLGVLLVKLKRPEEAADLLIEGIERGVAAVEPAEYQTFSDAYRSARAQVTWVTVTISQAGAKVTLDGEPKNEQGYSAFNIFVLPGEHELRASLEGYEDASVTFNALKGKEDKVTLMLKPFGKLLAKRETLRVMHVNNKLPSLDDPPEDEPEKRVVYGGVDGGPKPEKTRIEVAAGPVVVFGVASWQPAIGAVAGVRWRPKDYFSLGVEGRAAWLTSGVSGGQISAMTAGGIATACGHWRWLFGCAVGHLGVVNVAFSGASYEKQSFTDALPGGGGRVGAIVHFGSSFVLQGAVDALVLSRGMKIVAGQTTIVDRGPLMFASQLLGGWEF